MKNCILILILSVFVCSSCCALQQEGVSSGSSYVFDDDYEDYVTDYQILEIGGEPVKFDGKYIIEPKSNLDIENMSFEDFGSFFEEKFDVSVDTYKITEGRVTETVVYHIHSDNPGPVVYIAAGIHGNERAGWYAGILLRNATISCGDLYVLAPVNALGAKQMTRYVNGVDANRVFPGSPDGNDAQVLDWEIFNDIREKNPEIVLDLHEAITYQPNVTDFLGSTYIFTSLEGMEDLFLDMLFATECDELCHNAFGFTGPGPNGSLNSTVTNELGIPTITVETFRGYDIYRRVYDQLDTVQYVLDYKGMR